MQIPSTEPLTAKSVFLKAMELADPDERQAWLRSHCLNHPELLRKVGALLAAAGAGSSVSPLDVMAEAMGVERTVLTWEIDPAPDATTKPLPPKLERQQIGPYKLLEQIGQGGFGTVYMAEQTAPVKRKVALKVLKPGMDSNEVIARFEAERQALAMMDHPNIARVLDGGTTEQGRPYFVMELVRGVPVTEYCDEARATTEERLALFVEICRAVQHAHQKGIIHRDLKPSNILVTMHDDKPVPKVIDFGIAKALSQQLTDRTLFTGYQQMLGTPAYMSPEQAQMSGIDIDTRSDVYSLGVLLYELLTGTTPFEKASLANISFDDLRRMIREQEPPRPSARITTMEAKLRSTVADRRRLEQRRVSEQLRGELDWIVMKALEKDRNRRYGSAAEFAADIQRFLDDQPVLACPPSVLYLTGKFARQHRRVLTSAALLLIALCGGVIVSVNQAIRARNAEHEVEQQLVKVSAEQKKTQVALLSVQSAEHEQRRLKDAAEVAARESRLAAINEAELRRKAETANRESRWSLYVAHLEAMKTALMENNYGRLERLLRQSVPAPDEPDYRGWEWYYVQQRTEAASKALPDSEHAESGLGIAFHPFKNEFAAFTPPSYIDIWDATSLTRIRRLDCERTVSRIAWSPSGELIAVGTAGDGELVVLNCSDGQVLWRSQPLPTRSDHRASMSIHGLSWNSDSEQIAIGSRYGDVAIVNLKSRAAELIYESKGEDILGDLSWQPNAGRLAVGLRLGKRLIVDTSDRSVYPLKTRDLEVGWAVSWSRTGQYLATGEGNSIRITDKDGKDLIELNGHLSQIQDIAWIDDQRLISASQDRSVRIWDHTTGAEIQSLRLLDGPVHTVALSPRFDKIVMGSKSQIKVAKLQTSPTTISHRIATETGSFETEGNGVNSVASLSWSPDGTQVFAVCEISHASLSGGMGTLLSPLSTRPLNEYSTGLSKGNHSWSDPVDFIMRAEVNDWLQVDDPRTGALIQRIRCPFFDDPIIFWSGSEKYVMTYNGGRPPVLRESTSGQAIREWPEGESSRMHSGAWSHTEKWFLSAGWDEARLLCVDGQVVRCPDRTLYGFFGAAWHPSDQIVALGNRSGNIVICDGKTLRIVKALHGHFAPTNGLDFSPDGRRLASASADGTVRIWDVASGAELLQLTSPTVTGFSKVAWSPDGSQLAAGSVDRQVVVFGEVGDNLMPSDVDIPAHGAIYQHFQNNASEHLLGQQISELSWRSPLKKLLNVISSGEQLSPNPLSASVRQWLDSGTSSSESFDAHLAACLCAIDGVQDGQLARQIGEVALAALVDHAKVLGAQRSLELEVDLLYRISFRVSKSEFSRDSASEIERARQAALKLINEQPANRWGWQRALSLEIHFLQNQVESYLAGLTQEANESTNPRFRERFEAYRLFTQRVPQEVLPFQAPIEAELQIRDWIERITTQELQLGVELTFQQEWLSSLEDSAKNPNADYRPFFLLAIAQLRVADKAGYQRTCREMVDRFMDSDDPVSVRFGAWTACVAPESVANYDTVLERYEKVFSDKPPTLELGALLYRLGRFEQAAKVLESTSSEVNPDTAPAYVWYFLAMTQSRLGDRDAASAWFEKANTYTEEYLLPTSDQSPSWFRSLTLRVLRDEALLLIGNADQ